MIADDACRAAVHGDNYLRGLVPGAEVDWSFMQINNDCYVTITMDHGLLVVAYSAVQSSTQILFTLLFCSKTPQQ